MEVRGNGSLRCSCRQDVGQCGKGVSQRGGDSGVCSVQGDRAERVRGAEVVDMEGLGALRIIAHTEEVSIYPEDNERRVSRRLRRLFINSEKGKELGLNWKELDLNGYELMAESICTHTHSYTHT